MGDRANDRLAAEVKRLSAFIRSVADGAVRYPVPAARAILGLPLVRTAPQEPVTQLEAVPCAVCGAEEPTTLWWFIQAAGGPYRRACSQVCARELANEPGTAATTCRRCGGTGTIRNQVA